MRVEDLLEAAGGDGEEALRMLFVLARQCAAHPEQAKATGPELAAILASLLEGVAPTDKAGTWGTAHRMVTVAQAIDPDVGPTPTAATVAEAIEEVLSGSALEVEAAQSRYSATDLLGSGGMGHVHRVFDRRLQRSVARKTLHLGVAGLAAARRFAREAELTAQLDHPNIVPLYDFDRAAEGGLYFTMKEVRGRSLSEMIDDASHAVAHGEAQSAVTIVRLVRIFRQVCDGVAFAHDQGIAHRDLKPDNVMVGDFGEVQVMDWGLAEQLGSPCESVSGTPAYMAPEVAMSTAVEVSEAADVYALGATLYHLLAFHPPYSGEARAVLDQVRSGSPPPPGQRSRHAVPEELKAVVLRAMDRDPTRRYPGVASLAEDVQAWLDGRPLASLRYGRSALLAKWMRRNRGMVVAVGITAATAAVLGGVGLVRYVNDVTEARDEARRSQAVTLQERNRALAAEATARRSLVDAQLAAARASTETLRYSRADALYQAASTELERLDAPRVGVEIGVLDNNARATRPLFTMPLPTEPATTEIDEVHGWVYDLDVGATVVARRPPLFDEVWRASIPVPECLTRAARWETDAIVLYCADERQVERIDLGTGQVSKVTDLQEGASSIVAPDASPLLFVAQGEVDPSAEEPLLRTWRVLQPAGNAWRTLRELEVHELASAQGPWFLTDRYGRGQGTVLHHADRGAVRTVGLPLARGAIAPDRRHMATYHEGTHILRMEALEEGASMWEYKPPNPMVVWGFLPDGTSLFAAGAAPTILELSTADGSLVGTYDGQTRPAAEVVATSELVLGRAWDGTIRGYSRHRPQGALGAPASSLLPPGKVLVVGDADERELRFVDAATRRVLRRVDLSMLDEGERWSAESVQPDGALVETASQAIFVPLADQPAEVVIPKDGRPLQAAFRLPDGQLAYCRGSSVYLRDLDGIEHQLGDIVGRHCRDVQASSPEMVFVADFWDFTVSRFSLGEPGARWTHRLEGVPYRLSVQAGRVSVGDRTGRVTVLDGLTGAVRSQEDVAEGPLLGNAMTVDARYVATGGWDQRVVVLDGATGIAVAEDARHDIPVEWVSWSDDARRLVSTDPVQTVIRDLDQPARLRAAHAALSDLARAPDRHRTGPEWSDVARGLAANGLWSQAVALIDRTEGLGTVERARWHWLAGQPGPAAALFSQARSETSDDDVYLGLCEAAATSEAGAL